MYLWAECPAGPGGAPQVDLQLRLWHRGNASVAVVDCGLQPKAVPREELFPNGAALDEVCAPPCYHKVLQLFQ